jgi:formylmethanofuran dehydrogenase subunit B
MKPQKFNRSRGQTLVEFTVVLSLFLFLIFIVVDLGRVVFYYSAIQNAAREGARYGVNHSVSENIRTETQRLAPFLDPSKIWVSSDDECAECVKITIEYDFETITPLLNILTGNPQFTLHSEASMIKEHQSGG